MTRNQALGVKTTHCMSSDGAEYGLATHVEDVLVQCRTNKILLLLAREWESQPGAANFMWERR